MTLSRNEKGNRETETIILRCKNTIRYKITPAQMKLTGAKQL